MNPVRYVTKDGVIAWYLRPRMHQKIEDACDNRSGPEWWWNTNQGLTHSLDLGKEGLMPNHRVNFICTVDGCDSPARSRRLCERHYAKLRRYGDPTGGNPEYPSTEAMVEANTTANGDCIVWTGSTNSEGYGVATIDGRRTYVHRWAWAHANGPIPEGIEIDHVCFNRACCNPAHLRSATRSQNQSHRRGPTVLNKSTGVRNVYPAGSAFAVHIRKNGVVHYLGSYPTVAEAAEVAERERRRLFGAYA